MVSSIFWGYILIRFRRWDGKSSLSKNGDNLPCMPFCFLCCIRGRAGHDSFGGACGDGGPVFSIVHYVCRQPAPCPHVGRSGSCGLLHTRIQQFIIGWGLTDEVCHAQHGHGPKEEALPPAVYAVNFTAHGGWIRHVHRGRSGRFPA